MNFIVKILIFLFVFCGVNSYICSAKEYDYPRSYYLNDIKDRNLVFNVESPTELIVSNYRSSTAPRLPIHRDYYPSVWSFNESYNVHYLYGENALVVERLKRTTRFDNGHGQLLGMFHESPTRCFANLLPNMVGDTLYFNTDKTEIHYKGLYFLCDDEWSSMRRGSSQVSEIDSEMNCFMTLYGFWPHLYVFSDGLKRNLSIEFVSIDTLYVNNKDLSQCDDTANLNFTDCYYVESHPEQCYVVVKRLLGSTRKDVNFSAQRQLRPFNSSSAMTSQSIINVLTGDTLFFANHKNMNHKFVVCRGLLFSVTSSGKYGRWFTEKRKLRSVLSADKLMKLRDLFRNRESSFDENFAVYMNFLDESSIDEHGKNNCR